jgi:maintenance of morphology protein 1
MSLLTCMDFQGPIHVTELSLGDEFPIFSNARIRPSDDIGSMVNFGGQ